MKFCNAAAGSVTPGSTAVVLSFAIPGLGGLAMAFPGNGIYFSTAMTAYLCTGAADSDATDVAAAEIQGTIISHA